MAVRERQILLCGKDIEVERVRCDVLQSELAERMAEVTGKPKSTWTQTVGILEANLPEFALTQETYAWIIEQIHEVAAAKAAAKRDQEEAA